MTSFSEEAVEKDHTLGWQSNSFPPDHPLPSLSPFCSFICLKNRERYLQHPSTSFPIVISVNEGYQGIGKVRVNSHEELSDLEGILKIMSKDDTEVLLFCSSVTYIQFR